MRSCNVDTISPNCSLLAVGQSGRSGPRHQKSWGEHSLLRFAPQGFGYHNGLTANPILVKCVVPWIKTKIGTWCWRGCSSDIEACARSLCSQFCNLCLLKRGLQQSGLFITITVWTHLKHTHNIYIYINYIFLYHKLTMIITILSYDYYPPFPGRPWCYDYAIECPRNAKHEVPELFAARRLFGWFIFGSH